MISALSKYLREKERGRNDWQCPVNASLSSVIISHTGLSDHWKGDENDESESFLAAILRIITTRMWLSRVNPFTSLFCRILRYHILHKGKQHCPKRRQSCFRSEESIFGLILPRLAPHVWGLRVCVWACMCTVLKIGDEQPRPVYSCKCSSGMCRVIENHTDTGMDIYDGHDQL